MMILFRFEELVNAGRITDEFFLSDVSVRKLVGLIDQANEFKCLSNLTNVFLPAPQELKLAVGRVRLR
jgi:hypothetical protein